MGAAGGRERGSAFEVKQGETIAVIGIVATVAVGLIGLVATPFVTRYVRTLVRNQATSW